MRGGTTDTPDPTAIDAELLCGEVVASGGPCSCLEARAVLCQAWREQGIASLRLVDGPYSALVRQDGTQWAYRDASALCGLFACAAPDGQWRAASGLNELAGLATTIDRQALHEYLRLLDIAAPRAWLRNVCAVEAGQALRLSRGEAASEEPPTASRTTAEPPRDFRGAVDQLDQRLANSVAERLSDAERPAAFLSGGVDSALLCALAARRRPGIMSLTVGFDGAQFDEGPVAARVAAHLGLLHQVLRFGRQDYLGAFDRLACGMDQPMADPATMATLLAFDHCARRFDVVLDGTGADEAVGAMPPRHVRLAVEYGSRVPPGLRQLLVRMMSRVPGLAGYTPILDFEHPAETLMRWRGFTRAEIEKLCGESVSLEHTTFYRTFARFPRQAHYERYSGLLNAMPCDRLTQAMRLTGLRVRFPFCARDVDGFLRQLPTEWRHVPGQPKRILRELLARYVPRELWQGPKQGFTFPLHDFLAEDGFALVRQHVLDGRWLSRGLLRPEVVRRYAQAYIGGDRRLMFRVWALAVLGAWLDKHEDLNVAPPRA
jgi:asparagine synthase (glutamine-hydrolysing)